MLTFTLIRFFSGQNQKRERTIDLDVEEGIKRNV